MRKPFNRVSRESFVSKLTGAAQSVIWTESEKTKSKAVFFGSSEICCFAQIGERNLFAVFFKSHRIFAVFLNFVHQVIG